MNSSPEALELGATTATPPARLPSSAGGWKGVVLWIAAGLLVGGLAAVLFEQPLNWAIYCVLAVVTLALLPIVASVAGGVERLLLVLFVLGLEIDVGFRPIYFGYGKPAGPNGIYISYILLLTTALLLLWSVRRSLAAGPELGVAPWLLKGSGLFFLTGVLSMLNTPDRSLSVFGLFEILSLWLVASITSYQCASRPGLRLVRSVLLAGLLLQSLVVLGEVATGVQISLGRGAVEDYGWGNRYSGTLGVPSAAGTYLAVGLLFALGCLAPRRSRASGTTLNILLACGIMALLFTQARSACIAFVLGGAGLCYHLRKRGQLPPRFLAQATVVGGLALLLAGYQVASRFKGGESGDGAEVRWNLIPIALAMVKAHPILGIGLNTATSQVSSYAGSAGKTDNWVFIVHNQFLLIAGETGIPGLLAFVFLMGAAIRVARRAKQSQDPLVSETGAILFWCFVALVWALNLDHVSGAPTYVLVWFLLGMASGVEALMRQELLTPSSHSPLAPSAVTLSRV